MNSDLAQTVGWIAAAISISGIYLSVRQTRNFLNPIAVIMAFFGSMYVGKYLFLVNETQLVFSFNQRISFNESDLIAAMLLATASVVLFTVGFFWKLCAQRDAVEDRPTGPLSLKQLAIPFLVSLAAMVIAIPSFNPEELGAALNNRFELYSGRGYLFAMLAVYKIALMVNIAAREKCPHRLEFFALWAPTIAFDLATGSRGKLLIENVFPFLFIAWRHGWIHIGVRQILAIGALLLVFASVFRIVVRESAYEFNKNKDISQLLADSYQSGVGDFFDGPEAPYIDTITLMMASNAPPLLGETLLAPLLYPIPRAIFQTKPRGGSATLTEEYLPDYYYPFHIEISFPIISELIANFGSLGILIMAPLGALCGSMYIKTFSQNALVAVFSTFIMIRMILLFRNDLFNNAISALNFLAGLILVSVMMRIRPQFQTDSK